MKFKPGDLVVGSSRGLSRIWSHPYLTHDGGIVYVLFFGENKYLVVCAEDKLRPATEEEEAIYRLRQLRDS